MIQFPICPPEVFAWWVAQWFCSYVFVQYLPLVFIETQSYGYMHLNFQFCVCNSFAFILNVSHTEMAAALSSKHLTSKERCAEICITNTFQSQGWPDELILVPEGCSILLLLGLHIGGCTLFEPWISLMSPQNLENRNAKWNQVKAYI